MKKDNDCNCERGGSFPVFGDGFSRRHFLRVAGTGIVASYFADVLSPSLLHADTGVAPSLQKSAKNCILIFLSGAPSHTDTWDLKEGAWTPAAFAPTSYGEVRWPQGLMPKTAEQLDKIALIRSGLSWAAVHSLAQTWVQIGRNPSGATGKIAPHIGAVVSLEAQTSRQLTDVLPGFVALNSGNLPGSGYLPAKYAPFGVTPNGAGLTALSHPDGAPRLAARWNLLQSVDPDRKNGALGKNADDMGAFYDQAKVLIDSPDVNSLFSFTAADHLRYGSTSFGDSLLIAKKLVGARRGTRFVQVTLGGWDHHSNIYVPNAGLFGNMKTFDPAFGALLADLSTTAGSEPGKSLLDETMVVVLGEFGRTVGPLNAQGGRDHFLRMSIVMAGGGVKGGRVIGRTDAEGRNAAEFGWSANRDVRPEDVTSTIYSALGIDYTTVRHDDPLNRGFEYVPFAKDGTYGPVNELF